MVGRENMVSTEIRASFRFQGDVVGEGCLRMLLYGIKLDGIVRVESGYETGNLRLMNG